MRVNQNEIEFSKFLIQIGNGEYPLINPDSGEYSIEIKPSLSVAHISFFISEGADCVFGFRREKKEEAHYYDKNYFNIIRLLDCLYTIREIRNSIYLMIYNFLKV
jgi:hypothetical protein